MSPIALILNVILGGLLVAALGLGLRLDRRLRNLRDSQAGFIKAVAELDQASVRTREGLQQWREATDEARELLHDRIEKAKVQAAKLDALLAQPLPEPRAAAPRPVEARQPIETRMADVLRTVGRARPQPDAQPEAAARFQAAAKPIQLKPVAMDEAEARAAALAEAVLNLTNAAPRASGLAVERPGPRLRDPDRPIRFEPREPPRRPAAAMDDDLFDAGPAEASSLRFGAMGRRG